MDSNQNNQNLTKRLSIIDYIKLFLEFKKTILGVSIVISVIVGILMYFVIAPIFKSVGVVKITSKSSGLSGMLSSGTSIPGLGDVGELAGGSSASKELALYENILLSRRCIEEVVVKFKLNDEWEFKHMQDCIKHFKENIMEINKDKVAGTMEIAVYDKNPERSKQICDFLIFELNKINTEMNALNAKNNKEFIETRYKIIKNDLKTAEDSLKIFQDRYGLAPDLQMKAATQSQFTMEAELKAEEVKLELLKKIISPEQSEIKLQQNKIDALRRQIEQIKSTSSEESPSSLSLKGGPDIMMNFFRLTRNVEIQSKLLVYILPIFEQAKIEEKRETPSVIILDQPYVPEIKAKPKRAVYILASFFIALFFSYSSILIYRHILKSILSKIKEVN
ncbi:MAG: hypothetical protein HY959_01080 [Ignavibacteriae bacterium]|nr:hypothetical protein [Ignavibacteriota bacterium]